MNKEFISYNQALELKELGFDESCLAFYSPNKELHPVMQEPAKGPHFNNGNFVETLRAPLHQQAFRWLYQKLGVEKGIMPLDSESQLLLLKELIDKVSSKRSLV